MFQCATDNSIVWSDIVNCLKSGKASELLILNDIRTYNLRPKIDYVPTVVFNDIYDKVLQKLSLENFQDIIEFLVNGIDCETCHNTSSKTRVSSWIMTALFVATILYVMKEKLK